MPYYRLESMVSNQRNSRKQLHILIVIVNIQLTCTAPLQPPKPLFALIPLNILIKENNVQYRMKILIYIVKKEKNKHVLFFVNPT